MLSKNSVFRQFETKLKTPHIYDNWDSLYDWLTDLSWIDENFIIIEFLNFKSVLESYPKEREIFISCLNDSKNFWSDCSNRFVQNDKKIVEIII